MKICDFSSAKKYILLFYSIVNSFPAIYYYYFCAVCVCFVFWQYLLHCVLYQPWWWSVVVSSIVVSSIDLICFALNQCPCPCQSIVGYYFVHSLIHSLIRQQNKMPMKPIKFCCSCCSCCLLLFYVYFFVCRSALSVLCFK